MADCGTEVKGKTILLGPQGIDNMSPNSFVLYLVQLVS